MTTAKPVYMAEELWKQRTAHPEVEIIKEMSELKVEVAKLFAEVLRVHYQTRLITFGMWFLAAAVAMLHMEL